ncbi:MAG: toll/interleukin-1 receptor domain-containing protein [Nitrospirota bacterium]
MAQIFIAHSSKDKWLIGPISQVLTQAGVIPYLAELESPTPFPLPQKLQKAIEESKVIIAVLTHNATNIIQTRDIVNWEISAAYHLKKPTYVFREKGVDVPLMINYITDYFTYDPFDEQTLKITLDKICQIGFDIKRSEDTDKAILTLFGIVLGIIILSSLKSK